MEFYCKAFGLVIIQRYGLRDQSHVSSRRREAAGQSARSAPRHRKISAKSSRPPASLVCDAGRRTTIVGRPARAVVLTTIRSVFDARFVIAGSARGRIVRQKAGPYSFREEMAFRARRISRV